MEIRLTKEALAVFFRQLRLFRFWKDAFVFQNNLAFGILWIRPIRSDRKKRREALNPPPTFKSEVKTSAVWL